MTASPVFLDANVPLYAVGAPSPFRAPCRRLVMAAAGARSTFFSDVEVLQELLHVLRRRRSWEDVRPAFLAFCQAMGERVLPIDHHDLLRASELVERAPHASTRDLVHAAVMRRHNIERIVTTDRHFDAFPGITRLDPLDLDEWADPRWFPED